MNSKKLISLYEQQYKEFFAKNEIVCSVPFSINRANDADTQDTGISIKQKIPLRMYLGMSKVDKRGFSFGSVTYYDQFTGLLVEKPLSEYLPYVGDAEEMLNNTYASMSAYGAVFSLFCELPRNVGLGFDSCFSILVATMIARLQNSLSQDKLELQSNEPLYSAIRTPVYSKLLEIVETVDEIVSGQKKVSGYCMCCLQNGAYPVVSFVGGSMFANNTTNKTTYYAYKLNDVVSLPKYPYMSNDYGILFSGEPYKAEHSLYTFKERYESLEKVATVCKKAFESDIEDNPILCRPLFHRLFLHSNRRNDFIDSYAHVLGAMSLEMYYILTRIYAKRVDAKDVQSHIDLVNNIKFISSILRKPSLSLEYVIHALYLAFNKKATSLGVMGAEAHSIGGSLVFVLLSENVRTTLYDAIATLEQEHEGVQLLYTSWQDGLEYRGICFDQDFENGVLSVHMKPSTLCLQLPDGNKIYGEYEDILRNASCEVVVDTIYMKLYVNGQKTTSKDLHTQVGTVELLSYLLKYKNREVSSMELPISAYSKNKNEMNGKVVLPLIKLIKEKVNKDLPLRASGSLYEFSIKLGAHDITIGLLSKCS